VCEPGQKEGHFPGFTLPFAASGLCGSQPVKAEYGRWKYSKKFHKVTFTSSSNFYKFQGLKSK